MFATHTWDKVESPFPHLHPFLRVSYGFYTRGESQVFPGKYLNPKVFVHPKIFYLADKNLVIESNFFLSEYLATFERQVRKELIIGSVGFYLSRELGAQVERFGLHLKTRMIMTQKTTCITITFVR